MASSTPRPPLWPLILGVAVGLAVYVVAKPALASGYLGVTLGAAGVVLAIVWAYTRRRVRSRSR